MDILQQLGIKPINNSASFGANEWFGDSEESFTSFNPSNGKEIAKVHKTSVNDYEQVMQQAAVAFTTWKMLPAPKRGEIVRQIGEELRANKKALGKLVSLEMGKSLQEGEGEVQEMIDIAEFAVGLSRQLYGNTMHSERPYHRMYEQWHPLGVIGVISAFNFPVAVWSWNALIAAVCGNTVVWKPSSKTPLCAIAVQNICNKVMHNNNLNGVFATVIGGSKEINDKFINDKRMPLISFTGSCESGKKVTQIVSGRMGRTILELGGNNAIIVDETADLKLAIPAITFGAVGTAGQRCTSTRRLFVHKSRIEEVTSALVNAYEQITVGDPLDSKNLMGPLIDEDAVSQYLAAIAAIKQQGGKVIYGGNRIDMPGCFVTPALAQVKNDFAIVQQETFAPILYIMGYENLEEAIAMQNDVPQGLSSAIFTTSLLHAETFLSHQGSDCGIANVNIGTSGAEIGGAFGGEKETGGGREAGSDSWKVYMRRQTNTINWGKELPLAQGIEFNLEGF